LIGFKTLHVDRSTVETALASACALQKVVARNVPVVESRSFLSSLGTFLVYFFLGSVIIYALYVNKKIPQHWVEEVSQYIPKVIVDEVERSKQYFS